MMAGDGESYKAIAGAWIHVGAHLEGGVTLEPGAVVGPDVHIGRGCHLGAHSVVYGPTVLGEGNRLYPGAVLGGPPQDVGYRGEPTRLEIGDRNVFREGVTISRGSPKSHGLTRIGSDNYFMANSHVGHDSVVEDCCILANAALVAGHCHLERGVNMAGGTAIVQFTTMGKYSFLGGLAGARQDVEPFLIYDRVTGDSNAAALGVNRVALRRAGFPEESILHLREAYKVLYIRKCRKLEEVWKLLEQKGALSSEVRELLEFVRRKQAGRFGRQLDRA
ncbi:MAG: acyl-ACP--UDP-N-acetylglucosamine O-acyltransferase [Planctomycetes bacterium]|nr:acyl-ACP--UDP-N-acetylglucosamine O-acyltransferase [Planctomycetota bacterium]